MKSLEHFLASSFSYKLYLAGPAPFAFVFMMANSRSFGMFLAHEFRSRRYTGRFREDQAPLHRRTIMASFKTLTISLQNFVRRLSPFSPLAMASATDSCQSSRMS